jgi:hypothetical protein
MASGTETPKTAFAEALSQLIARYLDDGADPQDVVDELTREANLVFARYNLEVYVAAREIEEHPMKQQPAR